jgi:hypothetical protein
MLYLATAAIETGSRRARVLLAPDGRHTPLGPRLLSAKRGAAVLALLLAAALGLASPVLPPPADWPGVAAAHAVYAPWAALARGGQESVAQVAPAAEPLLDQAVFDASAESAAAAASAAAQDGLLALAEPLPQASFDVPAEPPVELSADRALADPHGSPHPQTARQPAPAPEPEPERSPPAPKQKYLPPDDPPAVAEPFRPGRRLVPQLSEATKSAAKDAVAALRAERGLPEPQAPPALPGVVTPPTPTPTPTPATKPATPRAGDAEIDATPAYALTTRVLRTRAESEQVQTAVRALLAQHTAEPLMVELMPAGDDWRVVCWPFARRQDAQLARALLLTRGLRLEAIQF